MEDQKHTAVYDKIWSSHLHIHTLYAISTKFSFFFFYYEKKELLADLS